MTSSSMSPRLSLTDIMRASPVIPVIAIEDLAQAVPLAQALVAGGIRVLEVTLRTAHGLAAIRAIAEQVPQAIVGVGTLTRPEEFVAARNAGAVFGVSPGLTAALVEAAKVSGLPLLPGVMTPSEVMAAREAGFRQLKLFPAVPAVASACSRRCLDRCRTRCSVPPAASRRKARRNSWRWRMSPAWAGRG